MNTKFAYAQDVKVWRETKKYHRRDMSKVRETWTNDKIIKTKI